MFNCVSAISFQRMEFWKPDEITLQQSKCMQTIVTPQKKCFYPWVTKRLFGILKETDGNGLLWFPVRLPVNTLKQVQPRGCPCRSWSARHNETDCRMAALTRQCNCATCISTMRTYSTDEVAKEIGVHRMTLQRWLTKGLVRPSVSVPLKGQRTLWRWTKGDLSKVRKLKGTQKPGPKR